MKKFFVVLITVVVIAAAAFGVYKLINKPAAETETLVIEEVEVEPTEVVEG